MVQREVIVHLGAHRTGTTSVQSFLNANRKGLKSKGIDVAIPPGTRERSIIDSGNSSRVLVSEENILGTMESNIWSRELYPNASSKLAKQKTLLASASKIVLTIRNLSDWWRSAIFFCARKDISFPRFDELEQIAKSQRSWVDVVDDVRRANSSAELLVREFGWRTGNPKQFLKRVSGWDEFSDFKPEPHQHNASPSLERLAAAFAKRNDFESLSRLNSLESSDMFTVEQQQVMRERYLADLESFRARNDLTFLVEDSAFSVKEIPEKKSSSVSKKPTTCLLRIGKTGFFQFRASVGEKQIKKANIHECSSADTIATTIEKFGSNRRIALFYRDPLDRFVDSFYSRMKQGRPKFNSMWSAEEAVSYSYFSNPNELAESLSGDDERLKSAALFAFASIQHLKRNLAFHLISGDALIHEFDAGNIAVCCPYEKLEGSLTRVCENLEIDVSAIEPKDFSRTESTLSKLAQNNLKMFWKSDFEIFDQCQTIAERMGFLD